MSYPINTTIPNQNNDPADDVGPINTNFVNINSYLLQDHVEAGSAGNGFHEQVTYFTENIPAILPTDTTSIAFTANAQTGSSTPGTVMTGLAIGAASAIAQNFLANQNAVFPLSSIRAFGNFTTLALTGVSQVVTASNAFNVSSISGIKIAGVSTYIITLKANCTIGNNVIVIPFFNANALTSQPTYTFAGGVLTLKNSDSTAGVLFNFIVLQI